VALGAAAFVLCLCAGPAGPARAAASGSGDAPQTSGFAIESDPLFDDDLEAEFDAEEPGFPDPAERTNRRVFSFNGVVDRWVLDPITRAYGWLFPGPVKKGIRNFFTNLGEPATTFNDILQLEWRDAGVAGGRFILNSSIGIVGLFDPAARMGLDYHRAGFGQTLALAGTPSGPYLVFPIVGPNCVRDSFGSLADTTMHPLTWFLGPANFLLYGLYTSGDGISLREQHVDELKALREGSIDYYAAMRNAYYQNRMAEIWGRREHRRNDWVAAPDAAERAPAFASQERATGRGPGGRVTRRTAERALSPSRAP